MQPALLSLIVPSRGRPEQLNLLLDGLKSTAAHTDALEVILVLDADDAASHVVTHEELNIRRVVTSPGQTMGTLNSLGYEASCGRYVMLLNDDVLPRSAGWDDTIRRLFATTPDDILLVHVNDLVMQRHLCTFPIVSRRFCELTGGICPRVYRRYRIDDHIEDHFNLLAALGLRRTVFVPDVIFEHRNYRTNDAGLRQYFADPAILAEDAPRFDQLFAARKRATLKLLEHIHGGHIPDCHHRRLEEIQDSFALRTPDRQRILTPSGIVDPWDKALTPGLWSRAARCWRERGVGGVLRAGLRRLRPVPARH